MSWPGPVRRCRVIRITSASRRSSGASTGVPDRCCEDPSRGVLVALIVGELSDIVWQSGTLRETSFSATSPSTPTPPPAIGANAVAVLRDYGIADSERLLADGVVREDAQQSRGG